MSDRALAYIATIDEIRPIPGYDRVEHARVKGWWVVVKKEEFKVGDKCIYFEVDSKVPENDERFAFLEPKHYKIKTQKMCKVYSQGLIMSVEEFPEVKDLDVGTDVTDILHIVYSYEQDPEIDSEKAEKQKYESMKSRRPKIFKNRYVKKIMKYKAGRNIMFFLFGKKRDKPQVWPSFIKKTDEERIENLSYLIGEKFEWCATEKIDGTSCSFAVNRKIKKFPLGKDEYDFIVCSRNRRQADQNQSTFYDSNIYWEMAYKYNVEKVLKKFAESNNYNRVVLQGEIFGDKIQGNPYKMTFRDFYAFSLYIEGERLPSTDAKVICSRLGITFVPILDEHHILPDNMEDMKLEADGYSALNRNVKREGIVYRSLDGQKSFKNVSREYLLEHDRQ